MLFTKLELHNVPQKGTVHAWYLEIRNLQELLEYLEIDTKNFWNALRSMRRDDSDGKGNIRMDHLSSTREVIIAHMIESRVHKGTADNLMPVDVISDIAANKLGVMMKMLDAGDIVHINSKGGYCNKKGFYETWNPTVIKQIEKDEIVFPIDTDPIKANVLIIENATSIEYEVRAFAQTLCSKQLEMNKYGSLENDTPKSIVSLKETDKKWVAASIMSSNKIVMKSELVDKYQIDEFMELFSKLENKEIYLRTNNTEVLKSHPLWKENNTKHKIEFF